MFIDIHTHQRKKTTNSIFNTIVGRDAVPANSWFSLGIHPWYIHDSAAQLSLLEKEINRGNPNLFFIGECGLDKVKGAEYSIQEAVFREQIYFSETYKKPLLIHCVKAFNELIKIKKEVKPTQPWVLHGFNRKLSIANILLENEFYLSFGMRFLSTPEGRKALQETPFTRIFLETDDNNDFTIEEVYILASEILNRSTQSLKNSIKENLWRIIG